MDSTVRSLLKQHNFVKLWISQTLQSLATVLLQVIVMVEVYQQTDSVLGSASAMAVMAFGSFLGGFVGSYRIQQYSLVRLIHLIGWIRAGITVILGLLLIQAHPVFLFLMFAALFLMAVASAWYQPARFALLPLIVSKAEYIKANSALNVIHQLFLVAGWGLGGILVVTLPFYIIVLIIALSFVLSGVCVRLINLTEPVIKEKPDSKPEPAWKKMIHIKVIRQLTIMDMSEALANAVWTSAFILAFTHEILNKGNEWWGFINASYWIGGIVGSLIVVSTTKYLEKRLGLIIGLSALVMAIFTFGFANNSIAIIALLFCMLMGPLYQARDICQETVLQDVIEPNERASIMAARSAVLTPWYGMTYLVMGWIADLIGIQLTYILASLLYGVTFLIVVLDPQLRGYQYNESGESTVSQ